MSAIPPFSEGQIEALARLLGECGNGDDISRVMSNRGLVDESRQSTKWRRLNWVFLNCQRQHGCTNQIIDFIQSFLDPTRFVGRNDEFEANRQQLNTILYFSGLEYGKDGRFRQCETAKTLDEAEKRVRTIRAKFQGRQIHPEVLKYCRPELLQDNYFHAVFEASKGLAQRIRDLSGVQTDGAALIDKVFSIEKPILAINSLRTETESNGTGVKIGVISNSYNSKGGAERDVSFGDLPGTNNPNGYTKSVHVLKDIDPASGNVMSDEGRAMLQIVHDIAPGAELAFYTGFMGEQDMANGIRDLADPAKGNCDIIVDDISYITEPFFRDGVVAKAVDDVVGQGVTFFTSAGNFGDWSL